MSTKLVLHTNPRSRGAIARWMLEEAAEPYSVVNHQLGDALKTPQYLALNPLGKVPVLEHGEQVVAECAAICAYIAARFPAADLAPRDAEMADYYRWLFFGAGPLESCVFDRALGREMPMEKRGMSAYGEYGRVMDALEFALNGKDYVVGARFTAADVYLGSHIIFGLQFGTIEKRPLLERYAERLQGRASYQRAAKLDAEAAANG
ncbi:MAG: glutathione S-transferase family protein [Neomegalonema sp.]|nr:glutathione S-transferase family protein [Neomegalonema sp.]